MTKTSDYRFPMARVNNRVLPPEYSGPIDVCDIDKTYLESEFENWKDLVGTALDRAMDRRTRPGMGALLRALRGGPTPQDPRHWRAPLYFVSATPPQLRGVIEGKMLRDAVEWDGISYKDHFALVRAGRFREVRRHAGYKLTALLEFRAEWPAGGREFFYGDDAEGDALIYSLYADIRSGALEGGKLELALARAFVATPDVKRIRELADRLRDHRAAPVDSIYIFRVAKAPKLDLAQFPLVTPVADARDCAERLLAKGRIAPEAIEAIARAERE